MPEHSIPGAMLKAMEKEVAEEVDHQLQSLRAEEHALLHRLAHSAAAG